MTCSFSHASLVSTALLQLPPPREVETSEEGQLLGTFQQIKEEFDNQAQSAQATAQNAQTFQQLKEELDNRAAQSAQMESTSAQTQQVLKDLHNQVQELRTGSNQVSAPDVNGGTTLGGQTTKTWVGGGISS